MSKGCVSKLTIDGVDYNLAQISDFSIIPSTPESETVVVSRTSGIFTPTGVSSLGADFVQPIITSGQVDKSINNCNAIYRKKAANNVFNWFINDSGGNALFGQGFLIATEGNTRTYFAMVFDSDGEYADIYMVSQYPDRNWTVVYHAGGNNQLGQNIYSIFSYYAPAPSYTSNGGGATHIAKVTGQLKDLSSNLSDILMVSGGGGGGLLIGEDDYAGADAGGISGSGSNSGNQSSGYAFGQGESGTNVSGGGGGYYGGEKGGSLLSGGAGSGYIGNSLVSNKKMVGYNVPTSSAESTKTESVSVYSATKEANKPKAGNGFARVKFVREST